MMKKIVLLLLPFLFFSCIPNLDVIVGDEEDALEGIRAATTTLYTFYDENPAVNKLAKNISRRFVPDTTLTMNELAIVTTRPGYDVSGWRYNPIDSSYSLPKNIKTESGTINSDIISINVTLKPMSFYATGFIPRNDTPYTVKHYKQDIDLKEFKLEETTKHEGTTDTEIDVEVCKKDYYGFEIDSYSPPTLIAGEGTAVFEIYYRRKEIKITFLSDAGTFSDDLEATSYTISGPYETKIYLPSFSRECFKLLGFKNVETEEVVETFDKYSGEDSTYEILWQPVTADGEILQPTDPKYTFKLMSGTTELKSGDTISNGDRLSFKVYDGDKELTSNNSIYYKMAIRQDGEEINSLSVSYYNNSYSSSYDKEENRSIEIPAHLAMYGTQIEVYMLITLNKFSYECKVPLTVNKMSLSSYTELLERLSTQVGGKASVSIEINSESELLLYANVLKSRSITVDEIDLVITGKIKKISNSAFEYCSKLSSVTLPEGVQSLEWDSFNSCSILKSIHIPSTVTQISNSAFRNCPMLSTIDIDSENNNFSSEDGLLLSKDKTSLIVYIHGTKPDSYTIPSYITKIENSAFSGCSEIKSITIPDSVKTIGQSAFSSCWNLESVTLPSGLSTISQSTFSWCNNLKSINIPSSVTKIESYAFEGCSSLTSITLPSSLTTIENGAFWSCGALTSITIPSGVTSLSTSAFSSCSSLSSISVAAGNKNYASENGVLLNSGKTKILCYPMGKKDSSFTIPNTVTEISEQIFSGCTSLKSVTIPNSVTKICSSAFDDCSSLTSLTIPNSVTEIQHSAFRNCTSLASIKLSDNLKTIESETFWDCSSLSTLTIPSSVTEIRNFAFGGCDSLTSVVFADTTNWYVDSFEEADYKILVDVTNPSVNAKNLKGMGIYFEEDWQNNYLHKKPEEAKKE